MKQNDLKDFSVLMAALEEVFSERPISSERVDIYFSLLKDLRIELIKEGVLKILNQRKYQSFPKPAEIRDAATGSVEDRAILAWNKALERCWKVDLKLEDPLVEKIVSSIFGGWLKFSQTENPGDRRSFIESYVIYANQERFKKLKGIKIKLLEK